MGNEKVRAAERATEKIEAEFRKAEKFLKRGRSINSLGIYMDRHDVLLALSSAIGALREADALLARAALTWPSDADYDEPSGDVHFDD